MFFSCSADHEQGWQLSRLIPHLPLYLIPYLNQICILFVGTGYYLITAPISFFYCSNVYNGDCSENLLSVL